MKNLDALRTVLIGLCLMLASTAERADAEMYRRPASFTHKAASLASVDRVVMPEVDVETLKAQDARRPALRGGPFRFAAPIEVRYTLASSGTWEVLEDGSRLWRLKIASTGALNLDLGLVPLDMPAGTGRWI